MANNTICFIICYNDLDYLSECSLYIRQLRVPDGFEIDIVTISDAESMTAGYQAGMLSSSAKYKIYLHQDTFILHRDFLKDTISIFEAHPEIGMLGMVGTVKLPPDGIMWNSAQRIGALRSCVLNTVDDYFDLPFGSDKDYELVDAVDGLLIMTQYDIKWRDDLFHGWDFYDISQSMEFHRAGYQIAVPAQTSPWTLHDCGFMNLERYHGSRELFLKEYSKTNGGFQ